MWYYLNMKKSVNKKYKFKFPKLWIIIAVFGLLLALACVALNAYRFVGFIQRNEDPGIYGYMSLILAALICLGFIVIVVWAAISSYYEITNKQVILRWGPIKNVIDMSEVSEIKFTTGAKKLELVFTDESYFLIVINKEWIEDFINELTEKFPKIPYIQETEPPKEKK